MSYLVSDSNHPHLAFAILSGYCLCANSVGRWELTDEYNVATNTMMAGGGHNYQTLTKGEKRAEHGSQYEMIRQWIATKESVATPAAGRIERAATII